jgi:orotate phosphoribosyltransferase-like protein
LSTKAGQQVEWRRSKVIELKARGMSQIEIARELQVSKQSISADVQYLRNQAKQSIKEYVTEELPLQYKICLSAMDTVIKKASVIMDKSDSDNREILQASELYKDTNLVKLELLSNATTIDSALNYIRAKQEHQEHKKQKKGEPLSSADSTNTNDDDHHSSSDSQQQIAAGGKQTIF